MAAILSSGTLRPEDYFPLEVPFLSVESWLTDRGQMLRRINLALYDKTLTETAPAFSSLVKVTVPAGRRAVSRLESALSSASANIADLERRLRDDETKLTALLKSVGITAKRDQQQDAILAQLMEADDGNTDDKALLEHIRQLLMAEAKHCHDSLLCAVEEIASRGGIKNGLKKFTTLVETPASAADILFPMLSQLESMQYSRLVSDVSFREEVLDECRSLRAFFVEMNASDESSPAASSSSSSSPSVVSPFTESVDSLIMVLKDPHAIATIEMSQKSDAQSAFFSSIRSVVCVRKRLRASCEEWQRKRAAAIEELELVRPELKQHVAEMKRLSEELHQCIKTLSSGREIIFIGGFEKLLI